MKPARSVIVAYLRLLPVLALMLLGAAHAASDEPIDQLMQSGQYAQALEQIGRQLSSQPANPQMRFLKAVAETRLGRADDALATLTSLTQDYPELAEPYNNLAVLYASQGRFDAALQALEMAVRLKPDYAIAHENLGDLYIRLGQQAYERALAADADNPQLSRKLQQSRELRPVAPVKTP